MIVVEQHILRTTTFGRNSQLIWSHSPRFSLAYLVCQVRNAYVTNVYFTQLAQYDSMNSYSPTSPSPKSPQPHRECVVGTHSYGKIQTPYLYIYAYRCYTIKNFKIKKNFLTIVSIHHLVTNIQKICVIITCYHFSRRLYLPSTLLSTRFRLLEYQIKNFYVHIKYFLRS